MSNSSSFVYYRGPSHWFKQLNNFSLSCPWPFGLVLFTTAQFGVKQVPMCFPFSRSPSAGAAGGATLSAVGPFLTEGRSSGVSLSWLRVCLLCQKPSKDRSLPSPPFPKAGDIKQIYACSLSSACTSGVCCYSS